MGVMLRVSGKWACFSRPELKVEAVSYSCMTPTAARAILSAIYWKPEINWVVDGIHVLKKIRTMPLMRNFVSKKIPNKDPAKLRPVDASAIRDQRNATILYDVDYVIKAHFEAYDKDPNKHLSIFNRRASMGQYFRRPFFGCREFSVDRFDLVDRIPPSELRGKSELGYMLHSFDRESYTIPSFFNAVLDDGFLKVPPVDSSEVKR